jgi:hypothetical protein
VQGVGGVGVGSGTFLSVEAVTSGVTEPAEFLSTAGVAAPSMPTAALPG